MSRVGSAVEQKDLLPLLSRALTQSGAAGQGYAEIAGRIASVTGGLGAAAQVQSLAERDDYLQSFVLSGRALDRNAQPFIELLSDLVSRLEVEPRRLKDVIAEIATRLLESLDPESQEDIDEAWAAEIEKRCAAVDAGTLSTSDWKDVRARIERELFGR